MAEEKTKKVSIWKRNNIADRILQRVISRKLFITLLATFVFLVPWIAALFGKPLSPILTENNMTLVWIIFLGAQGAQDIVSILSAWKGKGSSTINQIISKPLSLGQPAADPLLPDSKSADPATPQLVKESEEGEPDEEGS